MVFMSKLRLNCRRSYRPSGISSDCAVRYNLVTVREPTLPKLPDNFDELGPDEKESAKEEHTSAIRSKYYGISCGAHNKPVFNAMALDRCLWEPFTRCQLPSNGFLVLLRSSLIRIAEN